MFHFQSIYRYVHWAVPAMSWWECPSRDFFRSTDIEVELVVIVRQRFGLIEDTPCQQVLDIFTVDALRARTPEPDAEKDVEIGNVGPA